MVDLRSSHESFHLEDFLLQNATGVRESPSVSWSTEVSGRSFPRAKIHSHLSYPSLNLVLISYTALQALSF
jgi:hypothetical protein